MNEQIKKLYSFAVRLLDDTDDDSVCHNLFPALIKCTPVCTSSVRNDAVHFGRDYFRWTYGIASILNTLRGVCTLSIVW